MKRCILTRFGYFVVVLGVLALPGMARAALLDFAADDAGNLLVNGQDLSTPPEFGTVVAISSSGGNHLGAAIFDSTPGGPNAAGNDKDLLVGLGNIVILQNPNLPAQTVPGIFDAPNDTAQGGTITFQFLPPGITLLSIDLVDIDDNAALQLILTDGAGMTRTFSVPDNWTRDILSDGPNGFAPLNFMTLASQAGETGLLATATEDAGFNPSDVRRLDAVFSGSGGLDNLVFVPEPAGLLLVLWGLGLLGDAMRKEVPPYQRRKASRG